MWTKTVSTSDGFSQYVNKNDHISCSTIIQTFFTEDFFSLRRVVTISNLLTDVY